MAPQTIGDALHNVERHRQALEDGFNRFRTRLARPKTNPIDDFFDEFSVTEEKTSSRGRTWLGGRRHTVSREEIGRATWTFLHTLAAQYPEKPTFSQKKDVKNLIDILTRMYPCGECADHFKEVVAAHPPNVASRKDFSMWMCRVHNVVNRSLGKPVFNCEYVLSRWEGVECDEDDSCSLQPIQGKKT